MPVNTTNAAYTGVNIGVVGITGTFLGMPLEALMLGAIAGAVANGLSPTGRNVAASILASMVLAGAFSPVAVLWVSEHLQFTKPPQIQALNVAMPVVIGAGWSWAAPLLGDGIKQLWFGLIARVGGQKHD